MLFILVTSHNFSHVFSPRAAVRLGLRNSHVNVTGQFGRISLKLYERFLKNFENNTSRGNPRHLSFLNLTFQLKLKWPFSGWSSGSLVLECEEVNRSTWRCYSQKNLLEVSVLLSKTLALFIIKICVSYPIYNLIKTSASYLWPLRLTRLPQTQFYRTFDDEKTYPLRVHIPI